MNAHTAVRTVHGACPHDCPDTCAMVSRVEEGRVVEVRADPGHPVTGGWLCVKVRDYLGHVRHPDRILHPLRRTGPKGSGAFEPISWDAALAEIASRWRQILDTDGGAAILPYSYSGTLGLVQLGVASARLWNRMGACRLLRSICDAAARPAVEATLGARRGVPYHHVEESRLVVVWGHNPVSTAPHFMPFLTRARRRGARLVVIDPLRSRTAAQADLHVAPLPGTDGVLALGLAHVVLTEGLADLAWLEAHAHGADEFAARAAEFPPERVEAEAGVPAATVIDLSRLYARSRPALIKVADGVQRHRTGGQAVRAIACLPALTGQYGVRGGGLAYSTGGYLSWDEEAVGHAADCPPPGPAAVREVNMNRLGAALTGEVSDPPIHALFVFASNPAATAPATALVQEGLGREDLFTVVHDLFLTDTARFADIVLPATSQLEHEDLHKAYGHTHLVHNAPAVDPPGACRSNWRVMRDLAAALGYDDPWLRQDEAAVIDEILTATARTRPALEGVTAERLRDEGSVPLSVPDEAPFADFRFPTPSGRVELLSTAFADRFDVDPLPDGSVRPDDASPPSWGEGPPLHLVSPAAHHFVTSSFANREDLLRREGPARISVHPEDAAARGLVDGDPVEVANSRGGCRLRLLVTDAVRPGVCAAPKGRWGSPDRGFATVNHTTSDTLADVGGQSTFHQNHVWLRRAPDTSSEAGRAHAAGRPHAEGGDR